MIKDCVLLKKSKFSRWRIFNRSDQHKSGNKHRLVCKGPYSTKLTTLFFNYETGERHEKMALGEGMRDEG